MLGRGLKGPGSAILDTCEVGQSAVSARDYNADETQTYNSYPHIFAHVVYRVDREGEIEHTGDCLNSFESTAC
jgi:hypothetical protein